MERAINVAIAGLGFGEKVHLPALRENKDLKAVSLWHPRANRLEDACKENNLKGTTNWSELIADPAIDAVIIATPPAPRFQMAQEALCAGKHLLLEKPVTLLSEEIEQLQRLALTRKLCVAVDFEYRAVPVFMQAKRLLDQGIVGTPWLVKFDWLMGSRANPNRPWNWYSQAEQGGGVIGALGTHAFDILHWFFGRTSYTTGSISTAIKQRPDLKNQQPIEVTSDDVALSHLQLQTDTKNLEIPAQVVLSSVAQHGRGCWIEVYGSKGTLLLGSDNQKDYVHGFSLWLSEAGNPLRNIKPDEDLTFKKTWSDGRIAPVSRIQSWWGQAIRKGNPIIPGLAEGLASQKVCQAIREASHTGIKQKIFY